MAILYLGTLKLVRRRRSKNTVEHDCSQYECIKPIKSDTLYWQLTGKLPGGQWFTRRLHPKCIHNYLSYMMQTKGPEVEDKQNQKRIDEHVAGGGRPSRLTNLSDEEYQQRQKWMKRRSYCINRLLTPGLDLKRKTEYATEVEELRMKIEDQALYSPFATQKRIERSTAM